MKNQQAFGKAIKATATDGTHPVATVSAVASTTYYVTDVSASSDKAGSIILVKDGTTVIWQDIVGSGNYRMNFLMPLSCTSGNLVSCEIDATAAGKANLSGYAISA